MGAFDDLIPDQPPAGQTGMGLFDDLVPDQPAAPDPGREAGLGERFMVNMGQGFEGTLAGQAIENWQNEGNRYGAQAGTVQDILRYMAEQGLEQAPDVMPNPAQGGTPSPEGPDYLGAGVETTMPGRGTGDLAGMPLNALQERLAFLQEQQAQGQAEYEAERAPILARREQMPSWYEEEGVTGKGAAGIAALLGQLVGGTPSPENALAFGRGASVAGRLGRGAAGGAAGAGVAEPVVQEQELRRGEREAIDPVEGAINVALGGALGGVLNVTPDMARGVRRFIADRLKKPEAEVTPEDVEAFDPEELMRTAQQASDAATLDPESLDAAIRAATGTDTPPRVGEGMAPGEARRARRAREQELGQAFKTTDVLRREDVQPGEEGLELQEGAQPLRDPTGEQANPDSYGARSLAARTAQEMGVTLDENGIRLAARDIAADPGADPRAIVRSYSREEVGGSFDRADIQRRRGEEYARDREGRIADFEAQPEQVQQRIRREYAARGIDPDSVANAFTRAARQGDMREVPDLREEQAAESRREFSRPAFEAAERRRQRREEDLATGERVNDQASTYRTAEEPYERQGRREVTLIGARRNSKGQLVGGEAVEVLAYAQRRTPNGKVQDMARIVRGDEDPVWVPADQLETVTTPENPRMYGEALGQTREPPKGVMTGRGDSPAGFDASQTPQPRRAVDRQADPDGLRRGLYSEAESEPAPEGPGPRAEETYDGRTGRPYREADTTEMTPQGEARTEFQGEGGEMPITRTRRPVRETARPQPTPEDRAAWEGEPEDVDADFREMTDEEMDAMFEAGMAQPTARPEPEPAQPDTPPEPRPESNEHSDEALREKHRQDQEDLEADHREFEGDTGVIRVPEGIWDAGRPLRSDQRTQQLAGRVNEWYAGYLGREDLIREDVGLRGLNQTIRNLQDAGFLSPTGRIDQDVLTNMDPAARQRLFDTMDERRRRAEQSASDEREAWQNSLSHWERGILRVVDHWRANRGAQPEAQPRPEPAQPDTTPEAPPTQGVNANAPERLTEPEMAQALRDSKQDFGWAERGGELIRDRNGKPVGRTRWIPYREELMDAVKGKRLTREGYGKLVERALDPNGKPLTNRQRGIVDDVLDAIDPRAQERAEAEAEADADAAFGRPDEQPEPDFDLKTQTEESRRAEEQRTREAEEAQRRQREQEAQKAQADRDRDDFRLSGSDRPADEAASYGQRDLTDQPEPKPASRTPIADRLAEVTNGAELLDAIEAFVPARYRPMVDALRNSKQVRGVKVDSSRRLSGAEGRFATKGEINLKTGVARVTKETVDIDLFHIRDMETGKKASRLGDNAEESVAQIMLHELTHAATTRGLRTDVTLSSKVRDAMTGDPEAWGKLDASEKLEVLRRKIRNAANDLNLDKTTRANLNSASKDIAETVAWGMTNPEVQAVLKNMPARSKRHGNLFRDFIDAIREALGLGAKHRSALTDLVEQTAQIMADVDAGKVRMFSGDKRAKSVQSVETRRGGTQLYSGIPLDKIADAVKKVMGSEVKGARDTAEATGELIQSSKEALGGGRAKNRATKRSPLTDLWRVSLASLDGDLRTLVGKFNSPTLKSLPDMFHATAGRGDAVTQTFDEAVQARNNPRLREVDRILDTMRDAGLYKPEAQERIIKLLENPRARRSGTLGEVANRIEAFLKKELKYLREAGVEVGEVRDGYFPREMDTGKAGANREGFIRAAARAYKTMGLADADAKASAEAYWEATVYGASGHPGAPRHGGQTPSFIQSRAFSKAAAEHMAAFRVKDIDSVLSQYVMRATKRAEIARRFGDNWKDWADIEAKIKAEDPNAQDILPLVRDRVALSAGVNLHSLGSAAQHTLSGLRTWTTLATLPKAAISSVGELVIAPWRGTTGSIPGDLGAALMNLWAHMGSFTRTVTGLGRSEQLEAAFEMAEDIGIIAGVGHNSLMAARFAGGDPVGQIQSKALAAFFRRNLLEYLTNYTRVTSMQQGQVFLRRLGKQMERHPERTGYFLREMGVPRGEEAAFAAYLRDMGDDLPSSAALSGRYAGVYRNALLRFTDQTVMRPSASTKPKYASHPLGAMIFQLQAFGYAFQKNVLNRQARILASKDLSYADKLAFSAAALPSVAMLVGLQGIMRELRDELYDPDVRERKTPAARVEGAISQAGLYGVADPFLQSLTGVKYQRNPLASLIGPFGGGLADLSFSIGSAALNNSQATNTGERNLAKASYDWLLEPAAQAAMTPLKGGVLLGKVYSGMTVYGLPKGRDTFVDTVAGERNSPRKLQPIQGTLEWLTGSGDDEGSKKSGNRWSSSGSSRW